MLQPKRTKFRKKQKGRVKGIAQRGHTINFGSFGIKSLEAEWTILFSLGLDKKVGTRDRKSVV